MFILDFFLGGLMDQLIDWIYSQLVGFFGNFFAFLFKSNSLVNTFLLIDG